MKEIVLDPLDILEILLWGGLAGITLYEGLTHGPLSFTAFVLVCVIGLMRFVRKNGK